MTKLCLILHPLNKIAADKTKFPVGIDPVRDCDSHVKASPQTQTLETTNIVPTTFFFMVAFSPTDGTKLEKLIKIFLENDEFSAVVT